MRSQMSKTSSPALLPSGWSSDRDRWGREYYINHATSTTQWDHPQSILTSTTASTSANASNGAEKQAAPPSYADLSAPLNNSSNSHALTANSSVSSSSSAANAGATAVDTSSASYSAPPVMPGYSTLTVTSSLSPHEPPILLSVVPSAYQTAAAAASQAATQAALLSAGGPEPAYAAGALDPALASDAAFADAPRVSPLSPALVMNSAGADLSLPWRVHRNGLCTALRLGCAAFPLGTALTLMTLLFTALTGAMIAVYMKTRVGRAVWDRDLLIGPIIISAMITFMLYLFHCLAHGAAMGISQLKCCCCARVPALGLAGSRGKSSKYNIPRAQLQQQQRVALNPNNSAEQSDSYISSAATNSTPGPFNGNAPVPGNGHGSKFFSENMTWGAAEALQPSYLPKYTGYFDQLLTDTATYEDLVEYVDRTRTARLVATVNVRCINTEANSFNCSRMQVAYT